ncbi:MAG: VCBS repeat-containing protein [Flavobacteriales bacterium]|nr:VCBS repeat-containing protein [Flavobacteriales bacterium]
MKLNPFLVGTIGCAFFFSSCGPDRTTSNGGSEINSGGGPLLVQVPAERSGITFTNTLTESPEVNYFTYVYAYNGGGVAAGDINNDGLTDLYFTGNQVSDKLYLNKGGLKFEDITEKALGAKAKEGWRSGVSMADVNGDGWLDIYVCRSGPSRDTALTRNLFYQNNGDGTFTERAHALGIADTTHSTQAAFFDADRDGDLDLYVMNHPQGRVRGLSNLAAIKAVQDHVAPTDRFYRNEGGTFRDETYAAHVQNLAYSLGLAVSDLDQDGWPDVYEANDFDAPDLMYMNRRDGTFGDQLQFRTRHISNFGMGCDVADYNNDALPDIMVLDMTADDHKRNKTNMGSMSPDRFWANVRGGYFYQYMLNTLQLNNGNGTFSEVGQLAGVARTDWSWAPLFADLDNDGWKDLMITNGFKHDVRNNDYARNTYDKLKSGADFYGTLDLIPSTKLRNYLFRNNGDLTFADSSQAWGFTVPENSNGATYADLDNDGDLDLVINNLDEVASVHENTSNSRFPDRHWLRLQLTAGKSPALGAKVYARHQGTVQYQELYPVRGYQSAVEPILHFGLGSLTVVDTVEVHWPNGTRTLLTQVKGDQRLTLKQEDAQPAPTPIAPAATFFSTIGSALPGELAHAENVYDDFKMEVLLPHKQSETGPMLATADVNGDGRTDVYLGGSYAHPASLWLQLADGGFEAARSQPWKQGAVQEQVGGQLFDADRDGDMDLLVLAGSNEADLRDKAYTQRLYLNDGKANFSEAQGALPELMTSALRADAADIEGDGDMDLFIGGRQTPAHYPFAPRSYLLVNDGKGHFTDATQELAPEAIGPGMVTAVRFTDMDGDKDPDLLLAGEWMGLMLLRNTGGRFTDASLLAGIQGLKGWWSALATSDLNGDGRMDIVAGNLGWNSKFHGTPEHPVHIYWADFDDNGRHDIVLAKEKKGKQLPVRGRECSSQQCPQILQRFPTYEQFADADLSTIYTPEKLAGALHLQANWMYSTVLLQNADGTFTGKALPNQAQVAPINGIVVLDVNGDGNQDLVCAGNNWGAEVETVRYDAGIGCVLLGDGKGGFLPLPTNRSGFLAWGNVKDLALIQHGPDKRPTILVANNNDALQGFELRVNNATSRAAR